MRIGIDLGGTKIEGAVLNAQGTMIERLRKPTEATLGYEAVLEKIVALVRELDTRVGTRCQVGIGTPGAVSLLTGAMKNSNTTSLNGRFFVKDLQDQLDREIRIANDANCFALSEALDGGARGKRVVFGIILGTGCGAGIIFDGKVHAGPNAIAGEWGHNVLDQTGPLCYCGRHGCVESFLSGPGFSLDYCNATGQQNVDAVEIVNRAHTGEQAAQAALARYIDRFGRAVASVANILDPDVFVVGGGVSALNELYSEGPKAVRKYVFSDDFTTPIVCNLHGDSSGVRGAAMLWEA